MNVRRWLPAAAAAGAALSGCFATHSLTPLALDVGPAVQTYKPAPLQTMNFNTFSVFPLSAVNGNAQMKGADYERPILFAVRNILEARGYRFVPPSGTPDFLVGVDVAPPVRGEGKRIVEIPSGWKEEGRVPAPLPAPATLQASDTYGWGTWGDPAVLVPPVPKYPRPGGEGGGGSRYLMQATVSIVDGRTLAEVWAGTGAGIGRTSDIRVGAEPVLWCLLHQFPSAARPELDQSLADVPGLTLDVLTNDGAGFYPAITAVAGNSPGWKAGVLPYDMILAVGGEPTWNKPFSVFRPFLTGPKDSECTLTLWRNGRQVNATVRRVAAAAGDGDQGMTLVAAPMVGTKKKLDTLDIPRSQMHGGVIWPILGAVVIAATVVVATQSGK